MKRYLRKEIEIALTIITMVQIFFIVSINDFELKATPFILFHIAITLTNVMILKKYGKGILLEKENYE